MLACVLFFMAWGHGGTVDDLSGDLRREEVATYNRFECLEGLVHSAIKRVVTLDTAVSCGGNNTTSAAVADLWWWWGQGLGVNGEFDIRNGGGIFRHESRELCLGFRECPRDNGFVDFSARDGNSRFLQFDARLHNKFDDGVFIFGFIFGDGDQFFCDCGKKLIEQFFAALHL